MKSVKLKNDLSNIGDFLHDAELLSFYIKCFEKTKKIVFEIKAIDGKSWKFEFEDVVAININNFLLQNIINESELYDLSKKSELDISVIFENTQFQINSYQLEKIYKNKEYFFLFLEPSIGAFVGIVFKKINFTSM